MPENEVNLFKVTRTRLVTEEFRVWSKNEEAAMKDIGDNDEHENNPFAELTSRQEEVIQWFTENYLKGEQP